MFTTTKLWVVGLAGAALIAGAAVGLWFSAPARTQEFQTATVVLVGPLAKARAYFTAPHDVTRVAADLRHLLSGA
ncbi:MAG: hypothetical protein L0H83_10950 [Salinisphaera sp.]|nr:hypothetical protein [Salinisphaera sp.]